MWGSLLSHEETKIKVWVEEEKLFVSLFGLMASDCLFLQGVALGPVLM